MPNNSSNRSLDLSQRLYQRLLAAYPRRHREDYGGAMAQLFRDQCRDAWNEGRTRGLLALWLRTVPDLVKTSFIERCSQFNLGKFMADKLNTLRPRKLPGFVFFAVFTVVFLMTVGLATVITFLLPESYASTARLKVEPEEASGSVAATGGQSSDQSNNPDLLVTTFEIIQSQAVLSNVINRLNLNVDWGKKYYGGETLKTAESMEILKRRLDLKTVRNTKLISITVYSDDKKEPAEIANAIAQSYADYRTNMRLGDRERTLGSLQAAYRQQQSQIDQLQAEKDSLAQRYGIHENWDELKKQYETQLIEGNRSLRQQTTQLAELQALSPDKLRDVLPTITGDSSLSSLLEKLRAGQQQYAALKIDYGPSDLHITRVVTTIAELNQEIDARVAGMMTALASEVNGKQASLKSLQAAVESAQQNSKPTPENQPYWDKKHELEQLLGFHTAIGAKLDAEKMNGLIPSAPLVEIIDYAEPGNAPVRPNKVLNIAFGAVAGVLLGAVAGSIAALVAGSLAKRRAVARVV